MGSYQTDQNVSAQTETLEFDALVSCKLFTHCKSDRDRLMKSLIAQLIDMDGTIIDSTAAIVKFWHQFGKEIGVDGDGEF